MTDVNLNDYSEDDYQELCKRADALGMCCLSEEEQYVLEHYSRN